MRRTNSKPQLDTNPKRQRGSNPLSATRYRQIVRRRLLLEQLEDRSLLAALLPYQNAADPYDVDANGIMDVRDAYVLDQELKANGERLLAPPNGPVQYYFDVNGDDQATFADLDRWLREDTGTLEESPSGSESDAKMSNVEDSGGTASSMMCGDLPSCTPNSTLDGSRASEKYQWSAKHTLREVNGKMVRTTGNDNETDENNVREGHGE